MSASPILPQRPFLQLVRDFAIRWFPKNNFLRPMPSSMHGSTYSPRQSPSVVTAILASFTSIGPFLSRLVVQGSLTSPMFTITLQRDSIEVGGNIGMLAIGELPEGVQNASLTWARVRGYPPAAGGLAAPADSPNEVYPISWEIPLDDVYFDGQKLPRSNLSSNISLSALIDTVSHVPKPLLQKYSPLHFRATLSSAVLPTLFSLSRIPLAVMETFLARTHTVSLFKLVARCFRLILATLLHRPSKTRWMCACLTSRRRILLKWEEVGISIVGVWEIPF